jgi:putative hydrolase of the HAD superfamily
MASDGTCALLLDALGTLVELEPPWPLLAAGLAARGAPVGEDAARAALRAEIAFYRAEHHVAVDAPSLEALRDRCAEVLRAQLPAPARDLPHAEVRAALLGALRFRAFPEVPGVLDALRAAGHPLVVVSNWDVSLHEVLADTGLADRVDGVVTSAGLGVAKPDGRLFEEGLRLARVPPGRALHVGDSVEHDVRGALAVGIAPVLVDRDGARSAPEGVAVLPSLAGLPELAAYPR